MKHMSIILAVLLLAGVLAVLPLYVDEGGGDAGSSEPPAVEDKTVILALRGRRRPRPRRAISGGGTQHCVGVRERPTFSP